MAHPTGASTGTDSRDASAGNPWFLYLIECADGSFYAGITTDATARFEAHCAGTGAKYTRSRPPVRLLIVSEHPNRSEASKAEYAIKQLDHARKAAMFAHALQSTGATHTRPDAELGEAQDVQQYTRERHAG